MLSISCAIAAPVNTNTATKVAKHFWSAVYHTPVQVKQIPAAQLPHLYIYAINDNNNKPQGFVIIPTDDKAFPVIGYGNTPAPEEIPSDVMFWLNQYEQEIAALAAGEVINEDPASKAFISRLWNELIQGSWSEPKDNTSVSPMLTTSWNQSPYYNYYCPSGTPAGCSAIATAQVMRYWNHPAMGTGSHSYTSSYRVESADFGNTTYDWEHMPIRINSSSSMTEVEAVATLCYHVGVSMDMDYGPEGSGASILGSHRSAESGLKNYFGYKNTLHGEYKSSYSDQQWINMIKADLDAGLPIIYAGYDPSAGHAFVFDGYNTNDQFHINWGWGGAYNGYFSMGALNPMGGGTGTNTTNTFNLSNQAIFGIEPLPTLRSNPSYVNLSRMGDAQSVIISSNTDDTSAWHASCPASWLTITPTTGLGNGTLTTVSVSASENTTGSDRLTTITLTQGNDTTLIPISQLSCLADDMCSLRINMIDHAGDGWEGATLTLSSKAGSIYGTASINGGNFDIADIPVCPDTVILTWHKGNTDSECEFTVENSNGIVWINHPRNVSLGEGDTLVIPNPCGTEGGLPPIYYSLTALVNDSLYGYVTGEDDSIRFGETRTLTAIANPGYRFTKWNDGITTNPRNFTLINSRTMTARFASMGDDTLQYDNGTYQSALGTGGTIYWGIKLNPADLISRQALTGIKYYNAEQGSYNLYIYQGEENRPDVEVYSTTFSTARQQNKKWITKTFTTPVEPDYQKPLWIILSKRNGGYPAATTSWCGNNDGSWISTDEGLHWGPLSDHEINGTWMIRAIMPIDHNLYTLTLLRNRNNRGEVTGGGEYRYGEQVEINAIANEGFHFDHWSDSNTDNPRILTIKQDLKLRAYFEEGELESINPIDTPTYTMAVEERNLSILNATGSSVRVFDTMGRCIYSADKYTGQTIVLPNIGIFMVSVNDSPAQKVVAL